MFIFAMLLACLLGQSQALPQSTTSICPKGERSGLLGTCIKIIETKPMTVNANGKLTCLPPNLPFVNACVCEKDHQRLQAYFAALKKEPNANKLSDGMLRAIALADHRPTGSRTKHEQCFPGVVVNGYCVCADHLNFDKKTGTCRPRNAKAFKNFLTTPFVKSYPKAWDTEFGSVKQSEAKKPDPIQLQANQPAAPKNGQPVNAPANESLSLCKAPWVPFIQSTRDFCQNPYLPKLDPPPQPTTDPCKQGYEELQLSTTSKICVPIQHMEVVKFNRDLSMTYTEFIISATDTNEYVEAYVSAIRQYYALKWYYELVLPKGRFAVCVSSGDAFINGHCFENPVYKLCAITDPKNEMCAARMKRQAGNFNKI
jgi:hypothetical protein